MGKASLALTLRRLLATLRRVPRVAAMILRTLSPCEHTILSSMERDSATHDGVRIRLDKQFSIATSIRASGVELLSHQQTKRDRITTFTTLFLKRPAVPTIRTIS